MVLVWQLKQSVKWTTYIEKRKQVHQLRYRQECLDEVNQLGGSDHDWFDGRSFERSKQASPRRGQDGSMFS